MQTLNLSDVELGDRIRKNFKEDKIQELAESIFQKGLYHPIVLRDDEKTLVAGENRLRAIRLLADKGFSILHDGEWVPIGSIPYTTLGQLSEDNFLEAELEENILRQDLSWQERVDATKRLHDLRTEQHEDPETGKTTWTVKETAKEVLGEDSTRYQHFQLGKDLTLAEHLDDPDVASAKDEKEAYKVLERKKKEEARQEKAKSVAAEGSKHSLYQGDAGEVLSSFEDGTFDVICTDPPYGIDVHKQQQRDGEYHEYDDSQDALDYAVRLLVEEGYRVTKDKAHIYVFCDIRKWPDLAAEFWLGGWEVWERPLIWYKGNTGSFGGTDWGPRRTYEAVLYAAKGRRPTTYLYHDVISEAKPSQTEHPAGKPAAVFKELLKRSCHPGDKVLDPFAGGGPIFPAANELYAHATGIELHDSYHALAADILQKVRNNDDISDLANG